MLGQVPERRDSDRGERRITARLLPTAFGAATPAQLVSPDDERTPPTAAVRVPVHAAVPNR